MCQCLSRGGSEAPMETVVLEKTIIKLGSLLALGFGVAGANIISHNMKASESAGVNALVPGQLVDCVLAMMSISDFGAAIEVLQGKIMTFVNQIAEIIHGVVDEFHGAPNKNNGDTFLLIWKIETNKFTDVNDAKWWTQRVADMSVVSLAKLLGAVHRSPLLAGYRCHPGLQCRVGTNFRVDLTFGMHAGWAIEGAVGSEFKIDASYLSPNVSITATMERSTMIYEVNLVLSQAVVELCSPAVMAKCRVMDRVLVKGSTVPMDLYALDMDVKAVPVDTSKPLPIVWNTRNRYKARQYLESEKKGKLSQEVSIAKLFDEDDAIGLMRTRYTVEFFQLFNMGYQNYSQGEWQVGRRMLSCTRALL